MEWARVYSHDEGAQFGLRESLCAAHGGGSVFLISEYDIPFALPLTTTLAKYELGVYFSAPDLYKHRSNSYNLELIQHIEGASNGNNK